MDNQEITLNTNRNILQETIDIASTISQAMDTVEADISTPLGCKSALDLLESQLPKIKPTLQAALFHITDNWNSILTNELRAEEARHFLQIIEALGRRTEQFDDFCTSIDTEQLSQDLGREFYLAVYDTLEQFTSTIQALKHTTPQLQPDSPYKGLAKKLQNYVRTATDNDWENLILHGTPFRTIGKWEGTRVEATLLGTLFNIPAATLNKSLIFPTASGDLRKINYAQDKITCANETYAIYPLIKDYISHK